MLLVCLMLFKCYLCRYVGFTGNTVNATLKELILFVECKYGLMFRCYLGIYKNNKVPIPQYCRSLLSVIIFDNHAYLVIIIDNYHYLVVVFDNVESTCRPNSKRKISKAMSKKYSNLL